MSGSEKQNQNFEALNVVLHDASYCVIKLPDTSNILDFGLPQGYEGPFYSVSICRDEISIVCEDTPTFRKQLPQAAEIESGWTLLQIEGQLEFEMVGVIAGFSKLFASQGIPIFCFSTFNTDYFLIKTIRIRDAIAVLDHHEIQWYKANA